MTGHHTLVDPKKAACRGQTRLALSGGLFTYKKESGDFRRLDGSVTGRCLVVESPIQATYHAFDSG
jgi:hypothetical protein